MQIPATPIPHLTIRRLTDRRLAMLQGWQGGSSMPSVLPLCPGSEPP
jgi:hypothetical protein